MTPGLAVPIENADRVFARWRPIAINRLDDIGQLNSFAAFSVAR
jgi:hypothetical protein